VVAMAMAILITTVITAADKGGVPPPAQGLAFFLTIWMCSVIFL